MFVGFPVFSAYYSAVDKKVG